MTFDSQEDYDEKTYFTIYYFRMCLHVRTY